MDLLGHVISVARYPVKSMAGETVEQAFVTAHGLQHDRLYAFESSGAPAGMLRLTGHERREMLRYQPRLLADSSVQVETPDGAKFPVDSLAMLGYLQQHVPGAGGLSLTLEQTPQTDVRPLSLLSQQTVEALSAELGIELDARRFRANFLLSMNAGAYAEEALVGRTIALGNQVRLLIRERIPRCRFITYNPAEPHLAEPLFALMKMLERQRAGRVGIYASVVRQGWVARGDELRVEGAA